MVRERAALRQEQDQKREKANPRKPFTLQARQSVTALQLTPDERYVMALVIETGNARNTVVPNYVTESGYTEDISGRSNVGDTQNTTRLASIMARCVSAWSRSIPALPRTFSPSAWSKAGETWSVANR